MHRSCRAVAGAVKRAIDIVGAAVGLVLLSPLMAATAVAVWARGGRPVFYASVRVGRGGKAFRCYKFRTMTHGARPSGPLAAKNSLDERVTHLGRVLRVWSIDELPQLWNVLAGSMSLVGPRPLPVSEVEHLRSEPEHARWAEVRHRVRPGLTGLWQTSGRSDLGPEDMARLDSDYAENWSLGRDLVILAKTPFVVLGRRGAY
jgi:lipopolysaccharide/colanic/teichoic acid biosynthesis glycosyltransferase